MDRRKDNESYDDYKKRINHRKWMLRQYLKGRMFWDSSTLGTFIKRRV